MLDELGLDRQAALELKLKAALHQKILQLVKQHRGRECGFYTNNRINPPFRARIVVDLAIHR